MLLDGAIDLALLAHHAFDDVLEKGEIRLAALAVLEGLAHAPGAELRQHLGKICAGDVHLVKRLHGAEARRRARHLAVGSRRFTAMVAMSACFMVCLRRMRARAASAAPAPLLCPLRPALAQACASVSTVRMPLPTARPSRLSSISPRADWPATMS
jgi:hypothetical protein